MVVFSAAVFGAIAGSFLNALLFRYNTGRSFLRGRCRYCSSRISVQYPAVEVMVGSIAVFLALNTPDLPSFFFWLLVWIILLFVLVYDLRHKIIPLSCSALLAALGLLHVYLGGFQLVDAAGVLLSVPLLFVSLISRGQWMGWGDGMLEAGLALLLGLTAGLTAFMLAFWGGAVVGIVLLCLPRGYTMKSEVPFAPFLIFGAACAYFLHVDLFYTLPTLFF